MDESLILHEGCDEGAGSHLGKVVIDLVSKYESVVSPVVVAVQSRLRLIPHVERACAGTPVILPGRFFCSGYSIHPGTEQKRCPQLNSKSPETLGIEN